MFPLTSARFTGLDASGNPLALGRVYTYAAGTTTPQATYTTQALSTQNANPVVLDSAGRASIWLDPDLTYRIVLKDSNDSTVYDTDNVSAAPAGALDASLVDFTQDGAATAVTAEDKFRQMLHVDDFGAVGDGVTDDSAAIQAAIDYAESVVGTNAFNTVGVQINFGAKQYLIGTTLTLQSGGISLVGPAGRGAMLRGTVRILDIGDQSNTARVRFVELENLHLFCSNFTSSESGLKLYRTIQCQIEKCKFTNWNIAIDCFRAATTHLDRCFIAIPNRTAQAQAGIRMQGLDETNWATPNTYTPGGGFHLTDCEFDGNGAGGAVDTTYGLEVHSVDGLYLTQCHWTDYVYTLGLVPDGTPANRVIIDVHAVNCYFDGPSSLSAASHNILIGGTVRESITMASGATSNSLYQNITITGGHIRGDDEADRCVVVKVTDADSWWDSSRRIQAITFNGVLIGQSTYCAVQVFGAGNTPTDTYVEPFALIFDGCTFYENASSSPSGIGTAITGQAEHIIVSNCTFLPDAGTSDYVVSIVTTDAGDDDGFGATVVGDNDFSQATGFTVSPVNITQSSAGANVSQIGNLYPGTGRRVDETYKITTTNATTTTIWSFTVPQGTSGTAEVFINGSTADGSKAITYSFSVGFRRNGSATSLSTGTANWTGGLAWNPDAFGTEPTATLSTNDLLVRVTGIAATTINWAAHVQMTLAR